MLRKAIILAIALLLHTVPGFADEAGKPQASQQTAPQQATTASQAAGGAEDGFSITKHSMQINGAVLNYTATAGRMRMKDEAGKAVSDIFFVAYEKEPKDRDNTRPVTFAFNGGPGAASVWLHMGALGPRRMKTEDAEAPAQPPHALVNNEFSWLPFTDLVFIDPVGTGYSRPAAGEALKRFAGINDDLQSVGDFIRLYTTKYGRWLSPKFLAGESYGTLRAVGLAEHLYRSYGMDVNGLILISTALNFQTFSFQPGDNLSYALFLPSYAATAWAHKKLSSELQKDLQKTLSEAEEWAIGEYLAALNRGASISKELKARVAEKLAHYTGLPLSYVQAAGLRIHRSDFMEELLRNENRSVGLMDGRTTSFGESRGIFNDPGLALTVGPYVAATNHYLRNELKYESELPYVFLSTEVNGQWNWGSALQGYVNVMDDLQKAMHRSKGMRVFAASGYFDLDIPYMAAQYTFDQLELDPALKGNIVSKYYEGGHMMYTDEPTLQKITADVEAFFKDALDAK